MRKTYVTYLRSAVTAATIALCAMVAISTQEPAFAEDSVELSPAECKQAPSDGHMRFNNCANLDASRVRVN